MGKKSASIVLLMLASSFILTLQFSVLPAHAMGCTTPCAFETITHVPAADHVVRVKLDGGSNFNLNHTFSFANNTVHTIEALDTSFIGTVSGMRYTWKQWSYYDGSQWRQWDSSTIMTTPPVFQDYTTALCNSANNWACPFLAEYTVTPPAGCRTNCNLDALTNVPASEGAVRVRLDGSSYYTLGHTFSFANGTVHTLQMMNNTFFTGATSGARYSWKQWSCTCGVASTTNPTLTTPQMLQDYTVTGVGAFTAEFDKEFQLTLSFTDPSGNPISSPSSITLTSGSTVLTLSSFSSAWVAAKSWTITDATWQGVPGAQVAGQTLDLTGGALNTGVKIKAFDATVKTVDSGNRPVQGVTVDVTFLNSTVKTLTTDSQGLAHIGYVPNGLYTARVTLNGSEIGSWSTDASSSPVLTVTVNPPGGSGGPIGETTVISAVVLLTIFGVALFLIVLAVKVRKPPPPPKI